MSDTIDGRATRVGEETIRLLVSTLGITRDHAITLHDQARDNDRGLQFVAQVILHTEARPRGWHAGATRYLLAPVEGRNLMRLTVLQRQAQPRRPPIAAAAPKRKLGPGDAPHCRAHPQFRSDCELCVSEREAS